MEARIRKEVIEIEQTTIFDMLYDTYQIKKPIRLIELFAGYGSQALALKYLGVNFEHHKICEWATKSIQAYNDLHIRDYTDYSKELTQNDVIELLTSYGVSMDYNNPMTYREIKHKGEKWQRDTYNNIIATHNLVNIQNVKAKDLNIIDTDKYDYILTYSFPCQSLSLAGKRHGMKKGSGTRSGMLWEVERLLKECEELPQILVMENVPQVHGEGNMEYFQEWIMELEKLGYTSFYEDLNSKNFCIPQNRRRTFMISLLGKYNYKMPKTMKLKYRLKDMLEKEVSKKYYLSDKMIEYISANNEKWTGNNNGAFINKDVASTLNTGEGSRRCDASNYVSDDLPDNYNLQNTDKIMVVGKSKSGGERSLILDEEGICNCLSATDYKQPKQILIKEKTKKECVKTNDDYLETYRFAPSANFMKGKDRFIPNKEYSDTILTQCKEGVVTVGNYSPSGHNASRIVDSKGIAPTVMENHGTVTAIVEDKPKLIGGIGEKKSNGGTQYYQQDRIYDSDGIYNLFFTIFDLCGIIDIKEIDKYERSKPLLSILWREITKEEIWEEIRRFYSIQKKNILQQTMYEDGLFENRKFQSRLQNGAPNSKKYNEEHKIGKEMFNMWEDWKTRYTPQRWELPEQQFEQFNVFMQKLPHETTSDKIYMQDMWQTNEGFRVLQQTLLEIQEIWRPTKNQISNGLRIRKLSTREGFSLMGVKDEDFKKVNKNQSDGSLYHLAGDSIVTTCLMAIFGELLDIDYKTKINDLVNHIVKKLLKDI